MKKKYPSQIKYEEENPLTCFRSKKDVKKRIVSMSEKSGISISELVRRQLLGLEVDFSKSYREAENRGYKRGYDDGYNEGFEDGEKQGYKKGMNTWAIAVYCWKCHKGFYVKPNSEQHKKLLEVTDGYLEHTQCPDD